MQQGWSSASKFYFMRVKPITVSRDLIPAILSNQKLLTRRALPAFAQRDLADFTTKDISLVYSEWVDVNDAFMQPAQWIANHVNGTDGCLLGQGWQKGDILYVREEHYTVGVWTTVEGEYTLSGRPKLRYVDFDVATAFGDDPPRKMAKNRFDKGWHWRNPRFMPRKYARIFLEVEEVRIERLQDILHWECVLEGVQYCKLGMGHENYRYRDYMADASGYGDPRVDYPTLHSAYDSFRSLWEKINGPDSWKANLWVWVIGFKRIDKPVNLAPCETLAESSE